MRCLMPGRVTLPNKGFPRGTPLSSPWRSRLAKGHSSSQLLGQGRSAPALCGSASPFTGRLSSLKGGG